MGVANSIITPQKIGSPTAITTLAETNYSAPVNAVLLLNSGEDGVRITRLRSRPRATVTATALHLYVSSDAGATKRLIDSALMSAHTVAATTKIPETDWLYTDANPMMIGPNLDVYVSQAVALVAGIVTVAELGDYEPPAP